MPEDAAIHVVPRVRGGWGLRRTGRTRCAAVLPKQRSAIAKAHKMAQEEGVAIYVHRANGTVLRKIEPPKGGLS